MARRSPPVVNQKYDTGCTWSMFRIFNFRQGHSNRRLVSSRKHLNTHANDAGNEKLRSGSDVIGTVDEKSPQIGVSSRRRRSRSCKSISCVENDQVADQGNEVTKMKVDQRFVYKNYQSKDGAGCEPNQLLDALQILYSNKQLFLKLLKDPNSLLVKQIHDLPSSHSSFSYNAQNMRPSHPTFGRINRKFRYFMKVRRKKLHWRTTKGVPYKSNCGYQGFEDGKKVKELEIAGRILPTCVHASIEKGLNSSPDLRKRHKSIKVKDSESCTEQEEAASFGDTNNTVSTSEQDIFNIHVEGRKSLSEMLNFGNQECKQYTNSLGKTIPLPDFESLPSLLRDCEHRSVTEGMKYDNNNQIVRRTKLGIQKEGENGSFNSSGQKINDPSGANVKRPSENLQLFGSDISIRKSPPGDNLHAHYDIPRDCGFKDTPTQNFDINNASGGFGSLKDSHPEIQTLSFSPEVASSCLSPNQRIEDNINMRNRVEHPSDESVVEQFTEEDVTNTQITIFKPDESPVQVAHDKFEENHFADLIRSSMDQTNNQTSSKDILDSVREILQAFILKCDEIFMKCESSVQMLDQSTFDELNGLLTGQLSSNKILLDCAIETFMEICQIHGFPPQFSTKCLDVQAYVVKKVMVKEIAEIINLHFLPHPSPVTLEQLVEKDLAKRGSWLNVQLDIQDIVIEVEEDVLERLVLEIVTEMDIRSMMGCNKPSLAYSGYDKAV